MFVSFCLNRLDMVRHIIFIISTPTMSWLLLMIHSLFTDQMTYIFCTKKAHNPSAFSKKHANLAQKTAKTAEIVHKKTAIFCNYRLKNVISA